MLKSLSVFAMLLGLGFFTIGCEPTTEDPAAEPAEDSLTEDPEADPGTGMETEEPATDPVTDPAAT